MPSLLLVMILLIGGLISFMVLLASLADRSKVGIHIGSILMVLTILCPIVWMSVAWEQDWVLPHEYHYIETVQYPSGKIVYMVYPTGYEEGHAISSSVHLTNDTIVIVCRKNPKQNGVNWHNGDGLYTDIVVPTDTRYNHLKTKAKRQGIKIVDIEIKEN